MMLEKWHLMEGAYLAEYARHFGLMEFRDAAPNPMFSELERWLTRFVRPCGGERWACPVCGRGRGRRWFWTQLVPFRAAVPVGFALVMGPKLWPALTPVCGDHPLSPWPWSEEGGRDE